MLEGKNILITGGAGFMDSILAAKYLKQNRITVYDHHNKDALSGSEVAELASVWLGLHDGFGSQPAVPDTTGVGS